MGRGRPRARAAHFLSHERCRRPAGRARHAGGVRLRRQQRGHRRPALVARAAGSLRRARIAGSLAGRRTGTARPPRCAALELDEREHGGPAGAARVAYAQLREFIGGRDERQVLRIWNYQGAINQGGGDTERYKLFCDGRAEGCGDWFADGYPAATAIGHHGDPHLLQVYLLASAQAGTAVENPRQVSAWRYPRQYGRTAPGFARAMRLPAQDALAISGTAAVVGHASAHAGDTVAQLDEILINLEALLASAGMPAGFDTHAPLKAYVRHPADAPRIRERLQQHLPGVPVLLLHGDVCRSELLVELDGWRYA